MKIGTFATAITAVAILNMPVAALAQGKQNFTLVNDTGYDIAEVYVSPHNTADWEEDVLGKDVLKNDSEFEIHFQRSAKSCIWDLKVVYDDDNSSAEWGDIDLCKVSEVTIHYSRKTGNSTATFR